MSKYILENGAILCEGKEIAKFDASLNAVITAAPLHHKIKSAISRIIEPNPQYIVQAGEATQPAPIVAGPVALDAKPTASDLDPAPAQDPALGDKTPDYIEWYRLNHSPEEFAEKYGKRRIPNNIADAHAEPVISNHMPTLD
jgi:hypothetical protein